MKYNKTKIGLGPAVKTTNHAGGEAYILDDRTALYLTVATSLGGGSADKYYVTAKQEHSSICALVAQVAKKNPEFIFQLAAYARQELHLRSIPTVLFIEGIRAMHAQKSAAVAQYPVDASVYAPMVFGRADEVVEAAAYWFAVEGHHKLPAPLRKSLGIALNTFDEYRLLKYNQTDKAVTFKDIIRLVHPEPKNPVQSAIFRYLVKDEVDASLMPKTMARKALLVHKQFDGQALELASLSHATWETLVSKFGSTKEVWEAAIPNMGYMALLRNLNNFIKADVNLDPVIKRLTDRNEVLKSKQLPFRFYSALKALRQEEAPSLYGYGYGATNTAFTKWTGNASDKKKRLADALGTALNLAVSNIPNLEGRTLVAADLSGSMSGMLNDKSTVSFREIAALMAGCATQVAPDNIACGFGTTFAVAKAGKNALETAANIDKLNVGHSTEAWLILDYLLKNKIVVDRVMYFTDTQCYGSSLNSLWKNYKAMVEQTGAKTPTLYEVNLNCGNTSNFMPQENVALIGGWSDRIFDLITAYESDPRSAVKKITEKYSLMATV